MNIKKILTPVDFSENSLNALRYAAAYAKATQAAIFILHVDTPRDATDELKENLSVDHLMDLLKKSDYLEGVKSSVLFETGNVSEKILETAQKNNIDLIVMGTQGAGNLKENLVGTNTTHVVGKATCPVLAVPASAVYKSIRKVVMAIDLAHRTAKIIEEIVNLVKIQQASILMVYVGEDKSGRFERELTELTNAIKTRTGYNKIVGKLLDSSEFPTVLETYSIDIEADMLVMITHQRGVFESIFDPSQTKMFAYHTRIPLFVVPHHKTPVFFF